MLQKHAENFRKPTGKMLCHKPKFSNGSMIFQCVKIWLKMSLDRKDLLLIHLLYGQYRNHPQRISSSSFQGYPLQARHKQDWGRGFILLLPQTAALPGSDAGSDVIKPASSLVIQNRQTSCSMWCPMYRARC